MLKQRPGFAAACGFALMLLALGSTRAQGRLDDASLRAYLARPYDKAALMNTTVELGVYRGTPVVAEFPCSDVCPQYTRRIVHFRLAGAASCASVGGVEQEVLVPVAITVRSKRFCMPRIVAESLRQTSP